MVTLGLEWEAARGSASACPNTLWDSGCPLLGGMHCHCEGSSLQHIYGMGNVLRMDFSFLGGASQALTAALGTEKTELV